MVGHLFGHSRTKVTILQGLSSGNPYEASHHPVLDIQVIYFQRRAGTQQGQGLTHSPGHLLGDTKTPLILPPLRHHVTAGL